MPDFCHRGGWLKKMPDFYLSIGLVDEDFINETLGVFRPGPFNICTLLRTLLPI